MNIKKLFIFIPAIAILASIGCGGFTQFEGTGPEITLAPGMSDTVFMKFSAEGTYTGEYTFTASSTYEELSGTVTPASASVDGTIKLTVTISVASTVDPESTLAKFGEGIVLVEGKNGEHAAGQAVTVKFVE